MVAITNLTNVHFSAANLVDDDLGARVDEQVRKRLAEVGHVLGVACHLGLRQQGRS